MFWFIASIVVIVGTPALLLGLSLLAFEIGMTATIMLCLLLLTVAGVISWPAMVSLVLSCCIVWFVCQRLMRSVEGESNTIHQQQ